MDTTAISTTDLVKRKHNNKWRDYHLLKHLVRMAYLSQEGYYEMDAPSVRLSMFKHRENHTKNIGVYTYYHELEKKYIIHCYIR
ncbi:MAG: hypothetical protein [Caudoviricetes sp.]|nr:MAG: hypothetical protein [Caudoviricetes sp.]